MVSKRLLLEVLEDVLTKLLLQTVAVESKEALQTIPVWRREEKKGKGRKRREAGLGAGCTWQRRRKKGWERGINTPDKRVSSCTLYLYPACASSSASVLNSSYIFLQERSNMIGCQLLINYHTYAIMCVCVWGGHWYHTYLLKCVLRKKDQNRKSVFISCD